MNIREAFTDDLLPLLHLYTHLHGEDVPEIDDDIIRVWRNMLHDPNHHVLVMPRGEDIIASCVLIVIPNMSRNQRPYALIENVVTHPAHRKKGHGTAILGAARDIAAANRCYKIMLMTGSKEEATFRFYENAGYNRRDKTAFVQWL